MLLLVACLSVLYTTGGSSPDTYIVDDSLGLGRTFDGIGAISGGGPNFGASLHILKVEIGGDSQSTDGVEASHMHTARDENYNRGYEWWMMKEAKKRNPFIKLYGLPWVFPGWLGGSTFNPYTNRTALVEYVVNWVRGALEHHQLKIDYVGMLRAGLNDVGFSNVQVVVTDGEWGIVGDLLDDPELLAAAGPIGVHYPGASSPPQAFLTDRPLWASEEYSDFNDLAGAGCWARDVLACISAVKQAFRTVIAWNLITSYYDNLPYPRSSLMVANQPWSGNYEVSGPIWITAHFTQFMFPGWKYLLHERGVGKLRGNGTYISLTSPDMEYLTIVVENLDPSTSPCFYHMPRYPVQNQTAEFHLKGSFRNVSQLRVWHSFLDFRGNNTILYEELQPIEVIDGAFILELPINSVYTLTTLPATFGHRGSYPAPPRPAPFPSVYSEDFEGYPLHAEAYNLAQQAGSFEVMLFDNQTHGQVLVQMVPEPPVDTCRPLRMPRPAIVFGDYKWADVSVQYDFFLHERPRFATGVYLAARVVSGGCDGMYSNGIYLWASAAEKMLTISGNHTRSVIYGQVSADVSYDKWHTLVLKVQGQTVEAWLDGSHLLNLHIQTMPSTYGFVALGTEEFGYAIFDNFKVTYSKQADPEVIRKRKMKKKFMKTLKKHAGENISLLNSKELDLLEVLLSPR